MKLKQSILSLVCTCAALAPAAQAATWRYRGNTPPTISGTPAISVPAGSTYSFTPVAADANNDRLRFYITNKPAWANFSSSTGNLSGTPSASQVGAYSNISIYVSDGRVSTFLPMFSLTVSGGTTSGTANRPPAISGSPAASVVAGAAYSFQPTASDADGDYLRYYIANKPAWATFNSTTGSLSGTPTSTQVGTYSGVSIYVSDSKVSTFLPAFTLEVTSGTTSGGTNHAPLISGSPNVSVVSGTAYAFQPSASDADGDALSFSVSGKPAWATFSVAKGSLTGTPTSAQSGSYPNIVITVNDGKVSTSLAGFGITVSAPASSGTATLSWSAPTLNTDGSALTNLGGYRIYHGTSASTLNDVRAIASPGTTSYQFTSLTAGTHYFAISAYNTDGVESSLSTAGSKVIP